VFVATLPLVVLPESSGPIAFVVDLLQTVAVVVGLSVVAAGLYSYRTGNPRSAVAAGLIVVGLTVAGALGGLVETSGGPLVPIWVWMVSILAIVLGSLAVADRIKVG
jgi:hypothetical protein